MLTFKNFVFTTPGISTFSNSQIQALQNNLITLSNVDPSRVNVTQRPNTDYQNSDGEIIVSISKSSAENEQQHSTIVQQFFQNYTNNLSNYRSNFFSNTGINGNEVQLKTLTFNETVGTKTGCYDTAGLLLLLGNVQTCTPNNQYGSVTSQSGSVTSQSGTANYQNSDQTLGSSSYIPIAIGVVIGIFSSVIIVVAILMIIPGTRYAIFPKLKVRNQIKQKIKESNL